MATIKDLSDTLRKRIISSIEHRPINTDGNTDGNFNYIHQENVINLMLDAFIEDQNNKNDHGVELNN